MVDQHLEARDLALACVRNLSAAAVNFTVWREAVQRAGEPSEEIVGKTAKMFGVLNRNAERARAAIEATFDARQIAVAKAGKAQIWRWGTHHCTTAHELAVCVIERMLELPIFAAGPTEHFTGVRDPGRVEDVIANIPAAHQADFLHELFDAAQHFREVDVDWLHGGIELEYSVAAAAETPLTAAADSHLTQEDLNILIYLRERHPLLQPLADIEAGSGVSRRTAGPRVNRLITECGFLDRPEGERGGVGLTPKGIEVARSLTTAGR